MTLSILLTKEEYEYLEVLFNYRLYKIEKEKKKLKANNNPKADQENERYKKDTLYVLDKELKVLKKVRNKNWKYLVVKD
tara:strand:+ start:378 stop:614 length:237 start_codon:yes stop_codon:yes gene_type:complete